jgi:hypothetical protein
MMHCTVNAENTVGEDEIWLGCHEAGFRRTLQYTRQEVNRTTGAVREAGEIKSSICYQGSNSDTSRMLATALSGGGSTMDSLSDGRE